jgi:DNA-binding SARP family transcriptional activator
MRTPNSGKHAETGSAARIRLFTLRPFQVLIQGEPLRFAVRVQRKPMELLKTLIALGGQGVAESKLGDALWPDSESDAALVSVRSTLHRLRKLLGRSALSVLDGKLTLDPAQCWADCYTFTERLADAERETGQGNVQSAWDQVTVALDLYRSPFLDGEFHPPEILVMRERLHSQLLRQIVQLGRL